MIKVKLCTAFYIDEHLHQLNDVLKETLKKNDVPYKLRGDTGLVLSFEYKGYFFYWEPMFATRIKEARNAMISGVLDGSIDQAPLDFDLFVGIDTDIVFELEHLMVLVTSKEDIIGLPYCTHGDRKISNVTENDENGWITKRYTMNTEGTREVGALPAGFTMYSRKLLVDIEYPWFYEPFVKSADGKYGNEIGEDMGICFKAKQKGYKPKCIFDYPVEHRQRIINFKRKDQVVENQLFVNNILDPFLPQDLQVFGQINSEGFAQLNSIRLARVAEDYKKASSDKDLMIQKLALQVAALERKTSRIPEINGV
jgi:hypothetical protein